MQEQLQVKVETKALIVGSGPAGSSMSLFLATYGIEHLVISKYFWTANTPRAHITNQRTVEIMRDLGIEDRIKRFGTPHHLMGDTSFCTSLTGEELGRVRTWGTHPHRESEYLSASPSSNYDLPQNLFEPILVDASSSRGGKFRFGVEYLTHQQYEDFVDVTVKDRLTNEQYLIRTKYLIGADGGRSKVASDMGASMEGKMDIAGSMNIVFRADLSKYVAHRPSVLYWVLQPGADIGGIGLGLVRMVRPWNEWLIVWGYDIDAPPPEVNEEFAKGVVRNLVGDESIDPIIDSVSLWGNNRMYATTYQSGRVFIMGDAAHRHPPSNGLGSNTSIQDAYNLAWKLALVLTQRAGEGLLASYQEERAPIGKQIVLRANKSIEEFGAILSALGVTDTTNVNEMRSNMAQLHDESPIGLSRRQRLVDAFDLKDYEFNAHGVELGQRYRSSGVAGDGSEEPPYVRDPELYYHPTTFPGARLPHVWVVDEAQQKVSTHDICGKGRFTLLTGTNGSAWKVACERVSDELAIPIDGYVIGPGQLYRDVYNDFAKMREVDEDGAILVRPDMHVAWRSMGMVEDPSHTLAATMRQILSL
ncbi:MAG: FAD-dependent monooxygenase [Actinomycetota bacterium]|nr:FAD-dependent monooxygenase [Actinomycetota bacterium]